jgi:hypothetical protein
MGVEHRCNGTYRDKTDIFGGNCPFKKELKLFVLLQFFLLNGRICIFLAIYL